MNIIASILMVIAVFAIVSRAAASPASLPASVQGSLNGPVVTIPAEAASGSQSESLLEHRLARYAHSHRLSNSPIIE